MANGMIKVNTDQVTQIASEIDSLNKQLLDELEKCKSTLNNLANVWTGEASNATREAFNSFANTYFQNYHDIIDQYVKFLKENVAQGYFETESSNVSLADSFK